MKIPIIIACALIGLVSVDAAPLGIKSSGQVSMDQGISSHSKPHYAYHPGNTLQHKGRILPATHIQKRNDTNPTHQDDVPVDNTSKEWSPPMIPGIHIKESDDTNPIHQDDVLGDYNGPREWPEEFNGSKFNAIKFNETLAEDAKRTWPADFYGMKFNATKFNELIAAKHLSTKPVYAADPKGEAA